MASLTGTLFDSCVQTVFAHWDVLRTIVDHDMGGQYSQEKAEWIPSVIVDLFQNEGLLLCAHERSVCLQSH